MVKKLDVLFVIFIVLNCLTGENNKLFLEYYKNLGIIEDVMLVFIKYSYYDFDQSILTDFEGSFIVTSFSSSLTSSSALSFISNAQSYLGTNVEVTEEIVITGNAIGIWKAGLIKAIEDSGKDIPPINYLRMCMTNIDYSSPSGTIKVQGNGFTENNMFLFKINNNKLNQIYPYRGGELLPVEANPYTIEIPKECTFDKESIPYKYSSGILATFYTCMGVGVLSGILSLIFVIWHRNQRIIRSTGRNYNYFLAIALIFTSISCLPLALIPSEDNDVCMSRPLYLGLSVKIILAILLAKSTKYYYKFSKRVQVLKTRVSIIKLFSYCLMAILVSLLIHFLWRYIDPNVYTTRINEEESEYFVQSYIRECDISLLFTIIEISVDGLLVVILLYVSYITRNVSNEFNDTFGMFLSACLLLGFNALMVAVDFSVNDQVETVLLTRGVTVQLNVIFLCILQYGIKGILIFTNRDAEKVTSSGSESVQQSKNTSSMSYSTSQASHSNSVFRSSQLTKTHTHTTLLKQPIVSQK